MPFAFDVSAKLKQVAFALAPASLTEKSQFLRPITFGPHGALIWQLIIASSNRKLVEATLRQRE